MKLILIKNKKSERKIRTLTKQKESFINFKYDE